MVEEGAPTVASLVEAHLGMALRLARRCEGQGVDRDDLASDAQMALFRAATNAVEDGDFRDFRGYAEIWIARALAKLVRDAPFRHIAGVPARLREAAQRCRLAVECLKARGILRPSPMQIAGEANIALEKVEAVLVIAGVIVRQAAIEWADSTGRAAYYGGLSLTPLFGARPGFEPTRPCSEIHGPIVKDSPVCCMACHESGLDHHPAMRRSAATDPKPDHKPKAHKPSGAPLTRPVETRREKRQRLWPQPSAGGA